MNLTWFYTPSSFHSLPITWTCHTPNRKQLLLYVSLLSALFVILAWRRICPGPIASDAAAECWAVPTMAGACAQIRVMRCVQQIYVLIACEWATSHACELPYLCSRSDTSQICGARWIVWQRCIFLRDIISLWKILDVNMRAKHFNWADCVGLLGERGMLHSDILRDTSKQQRLRRWRQAVTQIQGEGERLVLEAVWEPLREPWCLPFLKHEQVLVCLFCYYFNRRSQVEREGVLMSCSTGS